MRLFDGPRPRWLNIAGHRPFLRDLAEALYAELAAGAPEGLADALVLTPTRRAARALGDAFAAVADGAPVLLPRILAFGDLDEGEPPFEPSDLALELPPAITPSRRRLELARLLLERRDLFRQPLGTAGALRAADALADFIDASAIEELAPAAHIPSLAGADHAEHWSASAEVLALAADAWPRRLAELGLVDVAERRVALLNALAERWERAAPETPVVAAGSTGTAPATARLLAAVAAAPRGAVALPGLDLELDEAAWRTVADGHPQGGLKRLLDRAGVARRDVRPWPVRESAAQERRGRARGRLLNEALRPAEATADWLQVIRRLRASDPGLVEAGLEGLARVTARGEEEGALAAALLLRETLERDGRTALVITPDAASARRVSAKLLMWGLEVEASAGAPLAGTPHGVLISLLARLAADPLDPATLLAVLKHPLSRAHRPSPSGRRALSSLERVLRGPRPVDETDLDRRIGRELARVAAEDPGRGEALANALALHGRLVELLRPLRDALDGGASLAAAARALTLALEGLAGEGEGVGLWSGRDGEAASGLLAELLEEGADLRVADAAEFARTLDLILDGRTLAASAAGGRAQILGTLEARLLGADRLILLGLEEGVWPRIPPQDPFLSRPMREALGLPPPERRIGLAAHDFVQAASAPEVVMISCERRGGQPAVKSRWLWRLETLTQGAGAEVARLPAVEALARTLEAGLKSAPAALRPAQRPEPRPPQELRPRQLPVTDVERWVRDPYALYARRILGLKRMERPDAPLEASLRGTAVHAAFQHLAEDWDTLAEAGLDSAADAFSRRLLEELALRGFPRAALARERELARRLGAFAADFEQGRRARGLEAVRVETEGRLAFPAAGGEFVLTAKADRIEAEGGRAHVIDFKTGLPPSPREVECGLSPQLTLTAAILVRGGFPGLEGRAAGDLLYVRASGRPGAMEVRSALRSLTPDAAAEAAFEGLTRLISRFTLADAPYLSRVAAKFNRDRSGDYDHLARVFEWLVDGGPDEEAPA